ncbi:HU-CCDC81 and SPOR domain-containing protein [Streptomyces viridosporus]|uniref:pPIWI_RE_Y domain-containing protein n=1 Tax=Streptomyces viridosporus TaxID=67581 RepID=UPI0001AF17DF|nr:HU-CCDC81 and SPOR domain-containing protein [Streptomyces viridosporus]
MTTTGTKDARTRSESTSGTDEALLRQIATALACLSRLRTVPNPVYPAKVQNAYNRLVLHCLRRGEEPPGSVPEMVRWAGERPLTEWPLKLPAEEFPGASPLVDPETRLPHQLCLEWEVSAADPAAELFENELIREAVARCRAAKSPQAYTAFRALLTSRPVLTGAELALLGGDPDCGMLLHDVIKRCYEPVPASYQRHGTYRQCARCRCLMVPLLHGGHRCELDRCRRDGTSDEGPRLRAGKGGLLQLSRPLRMFITSPGLAETDLQAALLKKFGITAEMWPHYDVYDLRIPLPGGRHWAVDVKDRVNPVLLARSLTPFRNEPPYDRAFLVVPRYRFRDNEAYGRQFRRNLPEDLADRITLLDDRAFLRLVADEIPSPRDKAGDPRTEGDPRA